MTDANMPLVAMTGGGDRAPCGFRFDSKSRTPRSQRSSYHEWLNLVGLHYEVGSQDHDFVSYSAAIGQMVAEMAQVRRNHGEVLTLAGLERWSGRPPRRLGGRIAKNGSGDRRIARRRLRHLAIPATVGRPLGSASDHWAERGMTVHSLDHIWSLPGNILARFEHRARSDAEASALVEETVALRRCALYRNAFRGHRRCQLPGRVAWIRRGGGVDTASSCNGRRGDSR